MCTKCVDKKPASDMYLLLFARFYLKLKMFNMARNVSQSSNTSCCAISAIMVRKSQVRR